MSYDGTILAIIGDRIKVCGRALKVSIQGHVIFFDLGATFIAVITGVIAAADFRNLTVCGHIINCSDQIIK